MNKILTSLIVIGIVASVIGAGTIAYFSDTETSAGNTFTAGNLDLKVDSTCHYNGKVCIKDSTGDKYHWEGTSIECFCTWVLKDLGANDVFFNLGDVKPGDHGEDTISLHVYNNDAWLCAKISNLANNENGCNEPESIVDGNCGTPGPGEGELQNNLYFTIWRDTNCDNIFQTGEQILVDHQLATNQVWSLFDSTTGAGPLIASNTYCLGFKWDVPANVGNIIQSDSMKEDISFVAIQWRNNPNFKCVEKVVSNMMNFGPTGWAGWSCPAGSYVIEGTTNCSLPLAHSLVWKPGASVDGTNYPATPFGYTYTHPEEGWIVQNGGTSQSCKIYLTCAYV